jgi:hypothetical protein
MLKRMRTLLYATSFGVAVFTMGPSYAAVSNLGPSVFGTAKDNLGDGSFESITSTVAIELKSKYGGNFDTRGVWEFDLDDLPSGTITSISLKMINVSSYGAATYYVYGYDGDGVLNATDAVGGTLLTPTGIPGTVPGNTTIDVKTFIDGLIGGFAGFYASYPDTIPDLRYHQLGTQLVVEYSTTAPIPEPETYAMLLAGLGFLGWQARRRGSTQVS